MPDYFHTQDLIASFEPSLSPEVFDRRLLVVGLGGNGSHVALAAVRMGFSTIVGRRLRRRFRGQSQPPGALHEAGRRPTEGRSRRRGPRAAQPQVGDRDAPPRHPRRAPQVPGPGGRGRSRVPRPRPALDHVLRRRRLLPCPQARRDRGDVRPLGPGDPCLVDGGGAVPVPELPGPRPPVDGRVGPLLPQRRRRGTRADGGGGPDRERG